VCDFYFARESTGLTAEKRRNERSSDRLRNLWRRSEISEVFRAYLDSSRRESKNTRVGHRGIPFGTGGILLHDREPCCAKRSRDRPMTRVLGAGVRARKCYKQLFKPVIKFKSPVRREAKANPEGGWKAVEKARSPPSRRGRA